MQESRYVDVSSSSPGRIRLRLPRGYRTREEVQRIALAVESHAGVSSVQTNVATGSILVHYDQERASPGDLRAALLEIGVAVRDAPSATAAQPRGERPAAAANLTGILGDLNGRVNRATKGGFDLRLLVPLGLGALAARQVAREGWDINEIPWYVLAWDAFQSFNTLHQEARRQGAASSTAAGDAAAGA